MKITRTRIWVCRIVASATLGLASVVFYMAIDRDPPFERGAGKIMPENPPPGATVEVIWQGTRKRDCDGYVYRKIIDSHGVVFTIEGIPVSYAKTMNPDPLIRYFRLPVGLAPGPAKYIATTHYYCNPLHRWWPIIVETPHLDFIIAPPPAAERGLQGIPGLRGPQGERGQSGGCSGAGEGQVCREQ
jgi:hypothetical protein